MSVIQLLVVLACVEIGDVADSEPRDDVISRTAVQCGTVRELQLSERGGAITEATSGGRSSEQ